MDGQAVALEALRQDFRYPLGVVFALAADNEVVGKSYDEAPAPHPRFYFSFKPVIQYMVEVDISQ